MLCVGRSVDRGINTGVVLGRFGFLLESGFDIGHPPPLLFACVGRSVDKGINTGVVLGGR